MPVNEKKLAAMKAEYGGKRGTKVYYATENADSGKPAKKSKSKKTPAKGSKY